MSAHRAVRRSATSGGVYAILGAGQRALTFALLPVYTRALTPAQYGRVAVLAFVSALTYAVFSFGFDFAVVRQFISYQDDADGQQRFVTSVWLFHMVTTPIFGVLLASAVLLFAPTTGVFRPTEIATAVLASTIQVLANTVPLGILRARQRLRQYALLTSVTGISNAAFTVLFVVVLRWGVVGWLLGTAAANTAALATALVVVDWSPRRSRDFEAVRKTLTLGVPLVLGGIAGLSLQLGDRIVLSGLVTSGLVGVYSLGANLALPAQIGLQSLNQGFMPAYAGLQHSPRDTSSLRATITLQASVAIWVGVCLSLLGPPLVTIVAPPTYRDATVVVPWLTLGYVFYGLSNIPLNGLTFIMGRTRSASVITLVSAVVNLTLVAALTGPFGLAGAAAASAVGYLTQLLLLSRQARANGIRYSIDRNRIVVVALVSALVYAVGTLATSATGTESLLIRTVLAAADTALILLIMRSGSVRQRLTRPAVVRRR